jgi:hypothetical protein
MEESHNYRWMRMYFRDYIKEYDEFDNLTRSEVDEIFDQMLEHMSHIANTYLGD